VADLDCAPAPLERLITMKTAECEGIEPAGALLAGASSHTWKRPSLSRQPQCQAIVNLGPLGRKTVVCGAPNCRPGLTTVWARSAGNNRRRRKRWHAGQRRGTRNK